MQIKMQRMLIQNLDLIANKEAEKLIELSLQNEVFEELFRSTIIKYANCSCDT